ncbi:MAG: late competence development ComFB family protein [Chroococcales cyanobacterium]
MTNVLSNPNPLYRNALEPLVVEESQRQLQQLPPKMLGSLKPESVLAQVVAYALNRLPALYATSDRGWQFQQHQAQKLRPQIVMAVRQGFAAVQRDPLTPVWDDAPEPEPQEMDTNQKRNEARRRIASYRAIKG